MNLCVVDTSVVFKWYRQPDDEDHVLKALSILEKHLNGELLIHVPDLLFYELGNILRFKEDNLLENPILILRNTFLLGLTIHPLESLLSEVAFDLAKKYEITFYDASFMALSQILDVTFVTADKKLYGMIESFPGIELLANF
ncbi:MAG: type II toxin-antitoxin system VapC family toxin [Spirochaetota bacterium]|nr:MAG: type II toxin-antitoxin system VapC family toxin [Spirochaetota bacterium]